MDQDERLARGKRVFEHKQWDNPVDEMKKVEKIIYHEYFTSSHDDFAISVSLRDAEGNMIWKARFDDDRSGDAWAMTKYLQDLYHCPLEVIEDE